MIFEILSVSQYNNQYIAPSVLIQKIVNMNSFELLFGTHAIVRHKLYRKKTHWQHLDS